MGNNNSNNNNNNNNNNNIFHPDCWKSANIVRTGDEVNPEYSRIERDLKDILVLHNDAKKETKEEMTALEIQLRGEILELQKKMEKDGQKNKETEDQISELEEKLTEISSLHQETRSFVKGTFQEILPKILTKIVIEEKWESDHRILEIITFFGVLLQASLQVVISFFNATTINPLFFVSGSLAILELLLLLLFILRRVMTRCFKEKIFATNLFTCIILSLLTAVTLGFLVLDSVTVAGFNSMIPPLLVIDLSLSITLTLSMIYFWYLLIKIITSNIEEELEKLKKLNI